MVTDDLGDIHIVLFSFRVWINDCTHVIWELFQTPLFEGNSMRTKNNTLNVLKITLSVQYFRWKQLIIIEPTDLSIIGWKHESAIFTFHSSIMILFDSNSLLKLLKNRICLLLKVLRSQYCGEYLFFHRFSSHTLN
jgi:hypothetical protein